MTKSRILLVDDEPLLLRSLSRLLSARFQITTAQTCADAIAALEKQEFELLLCDLSLVGETAHPILAWARAQKPAMPRVVLSSAPDGELQELVKEGLANVALAKTTPPLS